MSGERLRYLPVRGAPESALRVLHDWLLARLDEPHANLTHTALPSWDEHLAFCRLHSRPCWVLLESRLHAEYVGTAHVTADNEVGIYIEPVYRRRGHAREALAWLQEHVEPRPAAGPRPGHFVAVINPQNTASRTLFRESGYRLARLEYHLPHDEER